MDCKFEKYTNKIAGKKIILFDYDSTIAKVPVDWIRARVACRNYLSVLLPSLLTPDSVRVDEMESVALTSFPEKAESIFQFRVDLETVLDGSHEAILEVCELIEHIVSQESFRLFIVSNNLHRTVAAGLKQLKLHEFFEAILGIDDVRLPKPSTRAFTMLEERYGVLAKDCVMIGDNDQTDGGFCNTLGIPFVNITKKQ